MTEGSLPEKAFLRDRYGNTWPVELARIENATFFLEGWAKFVKDNSVELGDFLVFQFDGTCAFDVRLLGHSACDKKGVGGYIFKVKEEEENEKEEDEKDERENLQNDCMIVDETDDNEEYMGEEEKEEELQFQEISKSSERAAQPKASGKVGNKFGAEASKRIDCYGFDLFKSGKVPQPKNPYFVTKMRAKRQDELYVPVDVVRDNNLELPVEILLRDPMKREWPTRLRRWSDGRMWYYGGWGSLCRLNLVGEEDTCICEIVKRRGGVHHINVTVVRPEDLA